MVTLPFSLGASAKRRRSALASGWALVVAAGALAGCSFAPSATAAAGPPAGGDQLVSPDGAPAIDAGGGALPIDGGDDRPPDGAPADGCEALCPGSCDGDTCVISCDEDDGGGSGGGGGNGGGSGACADRIVCPADLHCRIECTGEDSCAGGVDCTAAGSCEIECTGERSCDGPLDCGDGECRIRCTESGTCRGGVDCQDSCFCDVDCAGITSCGPEPVCPAGCDAPRGCMTNGACASECG